MLGTHKDLARKLEEIEKKYDAQFKVVFDAIQQLMAARSPNPNASGSGSWRQNYAIGDGGRATRYLGDGGLTGRGSRIGGGEAKVNVGNNVPEVCERGRIKIQLAEFQGVTRKKVSGTYFKKGFLTPSRSRGRSVRYEAKAR
jgi:hypothetical protein